MRCPVCKNDLKRSGEPSIFTGLPKEVDRKIDYYYCNNCHNNMNRCCFLFFKGTVFIFSDHKNWEELKFNPSERYGENYKSIK